MGQDLTTVKFEELYKGFSVKARGMYLIMNYSNRFIFV